MPLKLTEQLSAGRPFFLFGGYGAKYLTGQDLPAIAELLLACRDYFVEMSGEEPNPSEGAEVLLYDLPPGRGPQDKYVLGFYESPGGPLIGCMSVVRNLPSPGDWFVFLFLMVPEHRSKGLGKKIYKDFERSARFAGAKRVVLSVVKEQTRAVAFWSDCGLIRLAECQLKACAGKWHTLMTMQRDLPVKPTSQPGGPIFFPGPISIFRI